MVVVSHSHEFIFLKTRKTAGTSVEMYLEPFCRPRKGPVAERTRAFVGPQGVVGMRLIAPQDRRPVDANWYNHMSAADVRVRLGARIWRRYAKVATIRNPFDRAVSSYYFKVSRGKIERTADLAVLRSQFREFLGSAAFRNDHEIVHAGKAWIIDHALRFETLDDDLKVLAGRLDLDRVEVLHTKDTRSERLGSVADHFDTETRRIVRDQCAWMFERGGYSTHPADADAGPGDGHHNQEFDTNMILPDRCENAIDGPKPREVTP